MNKAEKTHEAAVTDIGLHPQKLVVDLAGPHALTDIVLSSTHNNAFKRGSNDLAAQPDGLFWDSRGQPYLMEYKSNDTPGNRRKAYNQLAVSCAHLRRYLGIDPILLYVHGADYKAEIYYP